MVEMLGCPDRETLLLVNARKLFANASQRRRWLAVAQRSGVVEQFELELRRYDGKLIWTEINARAVNDEQGRTRHWDGSAEDITARKRAEAVLRDSREQLGALAAYLQSVREEERTRVAREVQGEVGHALAGFGSLDGGALSAGAGTDHQEIVALHRCRDFILVHSCLGWSFLGRDCKTL